MRGSKKRLANGFVTFIILSCVVAGGCTTGNQIDLMAADKVVRERVVVDTHSLYDFPDKPVVANTADAIPADAMSQPAEFTIGAGDVLHLELFDDTTLNREVVVRYDGRVSLPLVDEVEIAGQTRDEAEELVRNAYSGVFRQPRLSLTVVESESKSFFVLGDISRPDEYPYKRQINLLQAINIAGGLRVDTRNTDSTIGAQGQLTKAFIFREVAGQRRVFEYDLTGLRNPGEHPSQAPVYPGDMIYVPEGVNLVYVMGQVRAPQVFPLIEGMTLLELLARAGGPIESAARMRSVVLLRKLDGGRTEALLIDLRRALQSGYSPPLSPGDIVYVPRSPLVRLHDNLMRFTQLTETVTPLLDLYIQGYDAWYTDERYDRLFDDGVYDSSFGFVEAFDDLLP